MDENPPPHRHLECQDRFPPMRSPAASSSSSSSSCTSQSRQHVDLGILKRSECLQTSLATPTVTNEKFSTEVAAAAHGLVPNGATVYASVASKSLDNHSEETLRLQALQLTKEFVALQTSLVASLTAQNDAIETLLKQHVSLAESFEQPSVDRVRSRRFSPSRTSLYWQEREQRCLYTKYKEVVAVFILRKLQEAINQRCKASAVAASGSGEGRSEAPQRWPLLMSVPVTIRQATSSPWLPPSPSEERSLRELMDCGSESYGLTYTRRPLLSQLPPDYERQVFAYQPYRLEQESSAEQSAQPSFRRRVRREVPRDENETEVPFHPLERFPLSTYLKIGVLLLLMGFPFQTLFLLFMIGGFHLSGSLDPFLVWFQYIARELTTSHWLFTDRVSLQETVQNHREQQAMLDRMRQLIEQTYAARTQQQSAVEPAAEAPNQTLKEEQVQEERTISEPTLAQPRSRLQRFIAFIRTSRVGARVGALLQGNEREEFPLPLDHDGEPISWQDESFVPPTVLSARVVQATLDDIRRFERHRQLVLTESSRESKVSRTVEWFENHPIALAVLEGIDVSLRWFYQLVVMFLFSLNPRWQPLRMFVHDHPLFKVISAVRKRQFERRLSARSAALQQQRDQANAGQSPSS